MVEQAASLFGVSGGTVYDGIRDGRLRTVRAREVSRRVPVEPLIDPGFRPQASLIRTSGTSL